ncbi:auxin-responsive protein SAUR50-like [Olea europaea var. sylvestris]|uniref:auxin-responsive protein SAUR50-like n=1 Tax=Olea europaea var. sylvestris TaxID=158386 RepID=UPI000C1CD426|nr:auxin-responsive protein SAUR50-like [Olea europaea var. sylvestris]
MDSPIRKVQKGLINKTWERCKSFGGIGRSKRSSIFYQRGKSKSLPHDLSTTLNHDQEEKQMIKKLRVAPQGCFFIYVGAQKQRFVIKTEYINHPLFKILLEEAESEYGYKTEGPLKLPCEVEIFIKIGGGVAFVGRGGESGMDVLISGGFVVENGGDGGFGSNDDGDAVRGL